MMSAKLFFPRAPRSRRPPGIRLIVSGVSRDTSWQVRNLLQIPRIGCSLLFRDRICAYYEYWKPVLRSTHGLVYFE